jgi:hypothetical protein
MINNQPKGAFCQSCAGIMKQMHIPEAQIEQTKTFIPMLKRWKK